MSEYIVTHGIRIAKDFTPETFGRLTTIGPKFLLPIGLKGKHKAFQVCACECGNTIVVATNAIKSHHTKSCKCLHIEKARTQGKLNIKHGLSKTAEYRQYKWMKNRCNNPNNRAYPDYGGRGIKVHPDWDNTDYGFLNFLADMGPRPSPKHEIERKDVNGNYCPENCCWATRKEQCRNKRNNHNIKYNGKSQCISAWSEEIGVASSTLRYRLKSGWSVEKALTTPTKHKGK